MITVRKSEDRGSADHGWLKAKYTFSFGHYVDRAHVSFRDLRVINEDKVATGKGFGTHPHENMEIITYIVSGQLEHKDSLGNGSVIRPGEIQRITAGSGITHSEFNPSDSEPTHLLQIWILPNQQNLDPSYEQRKIDWTENSKFSLICSPDGQGSSVLINQDVKIYAAKLEDGDSYKQELRDDRFAWIQVIAGTLTVNEVELHQGDGAKIESESLLSFQAKDRVEFLYFDLV